MLIILQLIINLPLLNVPLPSNVVLCFQFLLKVPTFELIDKEKIKEVVFPWAADINSGISTKFTSMDIFWKAKLSFLIALTFIFYGMAIIGF